MEHARFRVERLPSAEQIVFLLISFQETTYPGKLVSSPGIDTNGTFTPERHHPDNPYTRF